MPLTNSSLASDSESESDLDGDHDPIIRNARDSSEVELNDRRILEEEEEDARLLNERLQGEASDRGWLKAIFKDRGLRQTLPLKNLSAKNRDDHDSQDYGYKDEIQLRNMSGRSRRSQKPSRVDHLKQDASLARSDQCGRLGINGWMSIVSVSLILIFAISLGWSAKSRHLRIRPLSHQPLFSNGTDSFLPTTILISLDGFRADFVDEELTPTLHRLKAKGVSAPYMLPSFPSLTFPNHFTLVTGLYPEAHGIVGNTFWDPQIGKEFYYTDPARSMQPEWWAGGEPVWVTAEKRGVQTAVHMWPGSEAGMDFSPTYLDKFNSSEVLGRKTERILAWLDLPLGNVSVDEKIESSQKVRPQLIAAYVPNVDAVGHGQGPNSTKTKDTIVQVDEMLRDIYAGLEARNLSDIVNVVIVSDHGMASTSTDRLIALDKIIDVSLVEHIDGWPLYGLRPYKSVDLQELYDLLKAASIASGSDSKQNRSANGNDGNDDNDSRSFEVYLRDLNMPERYHFKDNPRIAPLWVVPRAGWAVIRSKEDFDIDEAKAKDIDFEPRGLHGYDHEHPLMRAIFVATGPAFASSAKNLPTFQNIEVYNIVCDTLGLEPAANNGTFSLPLGIDRKEYELHEGAAQDKSSSLTPSINETDSFAPDGEANNGTAWSYMKDKYHKAVDWISQKLHPSDSKK